VSKVDKGGTTNRELAVNNSGHTPSSSNIPNQRVPFAEVAIVVRNLLLFKG
jgi:hypothetical protein